MSVRAQAAEERIMRTDVRSINRLPSIIALCVVMGMSGCAGGDASKPPAPDVGQGSGRSGESMKLEIDSAAFGHGQAIPKRHTGEGKDTSPPVSWYNLPEGTQELALIVDDPDAPGDEPWVHWVFYRIPPTAKGLPEGIPTAPTLTSPAGAMQGRNSWPTVGYKGPMPPVGSGVHHYHFKLYALDAPLAAKAGLDKAALLRAMEGHILGQAEMIGTYERTQ